MGLGTSAAMSGLAKSVDYVGQNQREFAQIKNIESDIAKEEQANMLAQELEAKQYEEINAKASEMLAPDRIKIQAKSLELQKNIRSKIEEYGSRKAFFENGGVALLSKYKSDLLNSPETLGYVDNQKNMTTLMKMQADGKGHLIADADKQRLEDYNAGIGDGKITYSGMKSEVTIPEKYYNYGEDVPAEIILKSNYMAIYNNWLLDNPKLTYLKGDQLKEELLNYTMQNHYGQGTNMLKYQSDLSEQALEKQQRAVATAGTAEETDDEITFTTEMNYAIEGGKTKIPMTLENVLSDDNYMVKMASQNPQMTKLAGRLTPYDDASSNYTYADAWLWGEDSFVDKIDKKARRATGFDNKFKVAGAVMVPNGNSKEVLDALFSGATDSNNVPVTLNQSEYFSPNGEKLKKGFVEENSNSQPMKFQGLIYGFVDSQDKMIVKKLDSSGKPLPVKKDKNGKIIADDDYNENDKYSGDLKSEMFAVLVDSEGNKIYKKIGADGLANESKLNIALGKANNISAVKRQNDKKIVKENIIKTNNQMNARVAQQYVAIASAPDGVFGSPEFKAESVITKRADGSNRYNLHKAYYMALSYMQEGNGRQKGTFDPGIMKQDRFYLKSNPNNFSNRVNYSPAIKNALLNKKDFDDVKFINFMAKETAGENPDDLAENQQLAEVWTKFYELLNKK